MNGWRDVRFAVIAAYALLLCVPFELSGEDIHGKIVGTVEDSFGERLPGVEIEVKESATGFRRKVVTGIDGRYQVGKLTPGEYELLPLSVGGRTDEERQTVSATEPQKLELAVGQTQTLNLIVDRSVGDSIDVTAEAPLVDSRRSDTSSIVSGLEIEGLPIPGRDFQQFVILAPTAQPDSRGFVSLSGQRGVNSGLNIDGTNGKSNFFGYGRGGESSRNDGVSIAQESVQEFQVVLNGFSPEFGRNGGGYINVITKSGTNELKVSAFAQYRDDSMVEDLPSSPRDRRTGVDGSRDPQAFDRSNWGLALGGPVRRDRTHYFVSYDHTLREEPFRSDLSTPGLYDALLLRAVDDPNFLPLIDGFVPNDDGTAAADPNAGRTATGLFQRDIENLILFGKIGHAIGPSHTLTLRYNFTDYERTSDFGDEESLSTERTDAILGSWVSVLSDHILQETRIQYARDKLERRSALEQNGLRAQIQVLAPAGEVVGKLFSLPIVLDERTLQLQQSVSFLTDQHSFKFGIDYQRDRTRHLFAAGQDGRYLFRSVTDLVEDRAFGAQIFFGDVEFPNYDETQEVLGLFMQDSWTSSPRLTINYGLRWDGTFNPSNFEHVRVEGREVADDLDNFAPRLGFAYRFGDDAVLRGGAGIFHARTPFLLFTLPVQENGLFPNFGRTLVAPGQPGFVPLGEPIPNQNPDPSIIPNIAFVSPNFEDPETLRLNLGYERGLPRGWSIGVDATYAEAKRLHTNVDLNREIGEFDAFGRPIYSDVRPDAAFGQILVASSVGRSEYSALTLQARKRFGAGFQFQGHYTWSRDRDTDSNERSAGIVTATNADNPEYDWGRSNRDIEHRVVLSGIGHLPWGLRLSGIAQYRAGTPWTALAAEPNLQNYPDNNGPNARAVVDGRLVGRNSFSNPSVTQIDVRLGRTFSIGQATIDGFVEAFNLLNEASFTVAGAQLRPTNNDGSANELFGVESRLVGAPRQIQVGARFRY